MKVEGAQVMRTNVRHSTWSVLLKHARRSPLAMIALGTLLLAAVLTVPACANRNGFSPPSDVEVSQASGDGLVGNWELLGTVHDGSGESLSRFFFRSGRLYLESDAGLWQVYRRR